MGSVLSCEVEVDGVGVELEFVDVAGDVVLVGVVVDVIVGSTEDVDVVEVVIRPDLKPA